MSIYVGVWLAVWRKRNSGVRRSQARCPERDASANGSDKDFICLVLYGATMALCHRQRYPYMNAEFKYCEARSEGKCRQPTITSWL